MAAQNTAAKPQSQREKFEQAARGLETDDDPERFRERLGKLVKHKPVPGKATTHGD